MIFIDLLHNPPPNELIEEGKELTEQLKNLPPEQRDAFIDKNQAYWGKLKDHYKALSFNKCWYTEAREDASHCHMDHFRPKKKTIELKKDCNISTINNSEAYWWLAFNWKNYRYVASIPNTCKGTYFPLKPNTSIATDEDSLKHEWPGLLDPIDEYDVSLITFDTAGNVCPACSVPDLWDSLRVQLSIRVYDLNNVSLIEARIQIQQKCKRKIETILKIFKSYAQTNCLEYRDVLKDEIKELKEMFNPTAEFSAVARNYIRNYPEPIIKNIAL